VAVVLSASRMIATVQDLYDREPHLTARILGYWSNAFSAAVALCLLVFRVPSTCIAPTALQELERARILFRSAKDFCPRAMQVVVSSFRPVFFFFSIIIFSLLADIGDND